MEKKGVLFYEIMDYPIPKEWQFFVAEKKIEELPKIEENKFSRDQKDPLLESYIKTIKKYEWVFSSLPFVKHIYLCNSITFNKLHKDSDIDLFIVTKKGALWRARLCSALIFWALGLKRSQNKKAKKICLSFYVSEEAQNLYNISIPGVDIYLSYRLAHLVPLYKEEENNIYWYNQWLTTILPNFPQKHCINIGTEIVTGKSKRKTRIEKYLGGIIGNGSEFLIQTIWIPIILWKTKKRQQQDAGIIVNKNMLKFHKDIRNKIHLLYKNKRNTNQ